MIILIATLGTKKCISLKDKCNSQRDCPGGEDEENCAVLGQSPLVLKGGGW